MKQKQTKIQELINKNTSDFTTIRLSREVYNDLSKRGRYRDTHSDIIARLLSEEDKLQPKDGGSF